MLVVSLFDFAAVVNFHSKLLFLMQYLLSSVSFSMIKDIILILHFHISTLYKSISLVIDVVFYSQSVYVSITKSLCKSLYLLLKEPVPFSNFLCLLLNP